jgi:hypothetical protein
VLIFVKGGLKEMQNAKCKKPVRGFYQRLMALTLAHRMGEGMVGGSHGFMVDRLA